MSLTKEILSYIESIQEWRPILVWLRWIENFVGAARKAGYKVAPIGDGGWVVETEESRDILSSDCALYLFLLDHNVIEAKQLPMDRTICP